MRSVLSGVLSLTFEIVVCMSAFPDVRNFGIYIYIKREAYHVCKARPDCQIAYL